MSENELIEKYNYLHQKNTKSEQSDFMDFLYENTEINVPEVDVDAAWNTLHNRIAATQKKNYSWLRIAASIVVLVGVSLFVWQVSAMVALFILVLRSQPVYAASG